MILQIKNRSFPEIVGRFHLQIGAEKWNCPIRGCHFLENWFVKTCRVGVRYRCNLHFPFRVGLWSGTTRSRRNRCTFNLKVKNETI